MTEARARPPVAEPRAAIATGAATGPGRGIARRVLGDGRAAPLADVDERVRSKAAAAAA